MFLCFIFTVILCDVVVENRITSEVEEAETNTVYTSGQSQEDDETLNCVKRKL